MDIFEIIDNDFNKEYSCHSSFGQINSKLEKKGYSVNTSIHDDEGINTWIPLIKDALNTSLQLPNMLYFFELSTIFHTWTINISRGKMRILSSWEGDYCFEDYSKENKYGQFVEDSVNNELLSKFIILDNFHKLKFTEKTPEGILLQITEIYNELFRPGDNWNSYKPNPNFEFLLKEFNEINSLEDDKSIEWRMRSHKGVKLIRSHMCKITDRSTPSGGGTKTINSKRKKRKFRRKISKSKRLNKKKSKKRRKSKKLKKRKSKIR